MKVIEQQGWVYYINEDKYSVIDESKCGKWMYFFDNREYVTLICKKSIENNVVFSVKHTDDSQGVACFYLSVDDIEVHKKIILFFIENKMIRKTKAGKFYNISFKLDEQTRDNVYGDDFKSEIKLSTFIDLESGEWIYGEND